jgi:putative DNA methylase
MAGGGSIPLEGVRFGLRTFATELNPVAALILKATVEYPARFGTTLCRHIIDQAHTTADKIRARLLRFFPFPPVERWWADVESEARAKYSARNIKWIEADRTREPRKNTYLWTRIAPCQGCDLRIPLSTNFSIDIKGKPATHRAVFTVVPQQGKSNLCAFRIVSRTEWEKCIWPRPGFEQWDPRGTPTFKDGKAICPRCGRVIDGEDVKAIARSQAGGLESQLYAICSQVPIKLIYRNGEVKVRYLWYFRVPTQADLEAVQSATEELARLQPRWEAEDLIPTEDIPEGEKTREPRNMGLIRWRDLFLPRQLLTNVVTLEEIRAAQARVRAELPEVEAEAVSVYLAFILSKIVNYNSVNTFWNYIRRNGTQTFSRHDFAFRGAFNEFEGAREPIPWGLSQVVGVYKELVALIHGGQVPESVTEDRDDEEDEREEQPILAAWSETGEISPRPEVIVPTITCDDAAALSTPAPGTVHLICVDPPYYKNVQYAELSNFFYVWLKRALRDCPGLAPLVREPLAETNREAVANAVRWQREADIELAAWQARYNVAYQALRAQKVKVAEAKAQALVTAGPKPPTAEERADRFYEDKMAAVFRRSRQLLHPAGRMVVMFNHKQTRAWGALGMALIRAGFDIRSSVPIHTEAESSLNIRGLDAARSTVLLLCQPREETEQPVGNWGTVQNRVTRVARGAAERFQKQGLSGTDLYLSALGPALGEVARNWPVTDLAGRAIDLAEALDEAYKAVARWRLEQIFADLTLVADLQDVAEGFSVDAVDRDTQTLWLWLDTFQGDIAHSDDVRKLAKSLNVDPDNFKRLGLLKTDKEIFVLHDPLAVDLRLLSRRLHGEEGLRGAAARAADAWDERVFPRFVGAAVWNAMAVMTGTDSGPRGPDALRRWLQESGYGSNREFRGAFAVTLHLLEAAFGQRREGDPWYDATRQARRAWELVLQSWRF